MRCLEEFLQMNLKNQILKKQLAEKRMQRLQEYNFSEFCPHSNESPTWILQKFQ